MKDAQKPDHISLINLIGRLREGRFVIPDFQRDFEWKPSDIRELLKSIFLDYYIGSLLLWKGKEVTFDALACEPIYGFEGKKDEPEHVVLDGQQRLTALYYAFFAPDKPAPGRKNRAVYFLRIDRFMNNEQDEAIEYEWLKKRLDKILGSDEVQFAEHIFPLSIVGSGRHLYKWLSDYEKYWQARADDAEATDMERAQKAKQHARDAQEFADYVSELIDQYQVSYIELDQELEIEKVCDIFTQINSRGIRLDVFDLINALLKPKDVQLKHMWREAEPRLEFVETEKMNVYILQVMSILRQAYCSPKYLYFLLPGVEKPVRDPDGTRRKDILVSTAHEFVTLWDESVEALERAIKLLKHPHEFGVSSSNYIPYVSILPVFASLQATAKRLPAEQRLDAQRKIRHWYWASVFINRYSGSVESTSARDFLDVTAWFGDDVAPPAAIREFHQRFRSIDLRREVRRGTSVYNGIFNLLVLNGARDWMTGNVPQPDELDDHHIVPKSWEAEGLERNLIDSILNRSPLTDETNRHIIRNRLPNEYLPQWIGKNTNRDVVAILESHFISAKALQILLRDPFTAADFGEFILERQRTLLDAIEYLLVKERVDLPPNLRALDASIERVEISLRKLIADELGENPARLPGHIASEIDQRIQRAARKNATLDLDYYAKMAGKLEFTDLRELQGIITSGTHWPKFQDLFLNKVALNTKFDQLAELRNGIRHSRGVSQVAQKEGEAAVIWFEQMLAKRVPVILPPDRSASHPFADASLDG